MLKPNRLGLADRIVTSDAVEATRVNVPVEDAAVETGMRDWFDAITTGKEAAIVVWPRLIDAPFTWARFTTLGKDKLPP